MILYQITAMGSIDRNILNSYTNTYSSDLIQCINITVLLKMHVIVEAINIHLLFSITFCRSLARYEAKRASTRSLMFLFTAKKLKFHSLIFIQCNGVNF